MATIGRKPIVAIPAAIQQEVLVKAKHLVNGESVFRQDGGFVDTDEKRKRLFAAVRKRLRAKKLLPLTTKPSRASLSLVALVSIQNMKQSLNPSWQNLSQNLKQSRPRSRLLELSTLVIFVIALFVLTINGFKIVIALYH